MSKHDYKLPGNCPDYFGFGVLCNHPEYLVRSLNILFYGAGFSILGYELYNLYHNEADYHYYELAARVIGFVFLGILAFSLLLSWCTRPSMGFAAPFRRATLDIVFINSAQEHAHHNKLSATTESVEFGLNFNFCKTEVFKNKSRSMAIVLHMVFVVCYLLFWFGTNNAEHNASDAIRIIENIEMIREVAFIYAIIVPTFSVGVLDFAQIAFSRHGVAGRHDRLWWCMVSLMHRTMLYISLRSVVNPTTDLLHAHDAAADGMSDWEAVTLVTVTAIVGGLLFSFWVMYHGSHVGEHDKPFAYLDFPSTLVLVLAYAWCLNARIKDHHGALNAGYDFFVSTAYIGLITIGILNIPPQENFAHRHLPEHASEVDDEDETAFGGAESPSDEEELPWWDTNNAKKTRA